MSCNFSLIFLIVLGVLGKIFPASSSNVSLNSYRMPFFSIQFKNAHEQSLLEKCGFSLGKFSPIKKITLIQPKKKPHTLYCIHSKQKCIIEFKSKNTQEECGQIAFQLLELNKIYHHASLEEIIGSSPKFNFSHAWCRIEKSPPLETISEDIEEDEEGIKPEIPVLEKSVRSYETLHSDEADSTLGSEGSKRMVTTTRKVIVISKPPLGSFEPQALKDQ